MYKCIGLRLASLQHMCECWMDCCRQCQSCQDLPFHHLNLHLHLYDQRDDQRSRRTRGYGESDWGGDRYSDWRCVRSLYLLRDSERLVHGYTHQGWLYLHADKSGRHGQRSKCDGKLLIGRAGQHLEFVKHSCNGG